MSVLIKIARYICLSMIAIVFLAILFGIPSLLIWAIVFDWGVFLVLLLGALCVIEIIVVVCIVYNLSEW